MDSGSECNTNLIKSVQIHATTKQQTLYAVQQNNYKRRIIIQWTLDHNETTPHVIS